MKWNGAFRLLIAILACLSMCWQANAWSGKCVGVSDGDTIKVMRQGRPERIRLFGVDCPEMKQDFGKRAKQFTSSMVFGKNVTVDTVGQDRFGRTIAWVAVQRASLNRELIRAGLAWWYRKYAASHKDLEQLEQEAQKARKGLWSLADPVPPWEFRRERRR
jgi:micrococcal nuclease